MTSFAPPESCTDMRECRHWKKNCHKCLFRELVEALDSASRGYHNILHAGPWDNCGIIACRNDSALIEKAKLVEEAR